MLTTTFLETVLPSHGNYCSVEIDDAAPKDSSRLRSQRFVASIPELMATAAHAQQKRHGVFFALAAFDDSGTRKVEHALCLKSLFVDIDCGPNKAYPAVQNGVQALHAFVQAQQLPAPFVVASGGGVHAYWPFTRDVPVAEWRSLAMALKQACHTQQLRADATCTTDAARVLRIPGTKNFKQAQARDVVLLEVGVVTSPDDWRTYLPPVMTVPFTGPSAAANTDAVTQSLLGGAHKPAKFAQIVARGKCAQISHAATNAATLEEPLWRAALSIASNCVDAETAIHTVSVGHRGYSPAATENKASYLRGMPYTCAWYKENYPAHCQGCSQRVTSPIALGRFVEEAVPEADGGYTLDAQMGDIPVSVHAPELPFPYFRAAAGGIFKRIRDEDGAELDPVEIYPQDLYVVARFFDSDEHGDGDGELAGLHLHLPCDGLRRFHAPVTHLMAKDKLRDVLVKHGVITYGRGLDLIMSYLAASIRKLQSQYASHKTRSQMGWTTEGNFVVGDMEYTPAGVTLAPPASGTRQLAPLFHSRGTIEGWRNVVNFYNRPGMEGHAFGFLAGLGSPLLKLLNNPQVRGAVLNLVSNSSGTGKTTVQLAINSIFGHPVDLLMEAKDTPAARFHRLGTLNSICMTVDELTNATGEQLSALVYGSTSGRAPHRMEANTNKLRSNQTAWCSVTVTSSNAVMADALAAHRTAVEGELKRVIDLHISVPQHIPKAESDLLFSQLAENYGVAGPLFIQHVVANRDAVEAALQQMQARIDQDVGFERNDRFYSAVCTLAMVAGLIGNQLGIFSFDLKRIYGYIVRTVSAVRDVNAAVVGDTRTMALELMSKFISEHINNTLIISKGRKAGELTAPVSMPKGALKMRYEPDTDELAILAGDLREYFAHRRVDFKASMQEFSAIGALVHAKDTKELSVVRRIAAGAIGAMAAPAARCYVFRGAALGVDSATLRDAA